MREESVAERGGILEEGRARLILQREEPAPGRELHQAPAVEVEVLEAWPRHAVHEARQIRRPDRLEGADVAQSREDQRDVGRQPGGGRLEHGAPEFPMDRAEEGLRRERDGGNQIRPPETGAQHQALELTVRKQRPPGLGALLPRSMAARVAAHDRARARPWRLTPATKCARLCIASSVPFARRPDSHPPARSFSVTPSLRRDPPPRPMSDRFGAPTAPRTTGGTFVDLAGPERTASRTRHTRARSHVASARRADARGQRAGVVGRAHREPIER